MNFSDFKLMQVPAQAHIVYQKGIYLGEQKEGDHFIALYQVDDFYVEVYYRLQDDEIIRFRSFHSTNLLAPYLDQVDIDCLLQYHYK